MSCPSRFRMTQTSGFQTEHPQHFHSLSSRSRSLLFPSFISLSHYFPSPAPSTLTPAHSGEREMARARNEPRDAEMPANTRTTTRCLWKKQADAKSLVYYTMGNLMGTFQRNVPIGHRETGILLAIRAGCVCVSRKQIHHPSLHRLAALSRADVQPTFSTTAFANTFLTAVGAHRLDALRVCCLQLPPRMLALSPSGRCAPQDPYDAVPDSDSACEES